jgi:glycosyltransferase involved in cell wall biosynthesis
MGGHTMSIKSSHGKHRVLFTTPTLTHYRVGFHERVRELLHENAVEYELIYGAPSERDRTKRDCADIVWATKVANRYGKGMFDRVLWQPYLSHIREGDLVVLPQENRVLTNYIVQTMRSRWSVRAALWGHGRNFQSPNPVGIAERWKKLWATRCDWWFTYTEQTAAIVSSYGFPLDKITVIQNAVDTSRLRDIAADVQIESLADLREKWNLSTENVGIYVGGLYREKRIEFLLEASIAIRKSIPDFTLVIIGDGPDRNIVQLAAEQHSWIRYLGTRFDREKVEVMTLAKAFLMPGAVGLAALDCMTLGLPMITTDYPFHGPEIGYLQNDENCLIVSGWRDCASFSEGAIRCLQDQNLHKRLVAGALATSRQYTIEEMAKRFVGGALQALELG